MRHFPFRTLLLGSLVALTACQSPQAAEKNADPSPPEPTSEGVPAVPNRIPTNPLQPKPIRIPLDSLPDPYATNSARKPPRVVDIPANASLNVPEGFQVNVFADKLQRPRWLALTPNGDVLVTETRQNRIRLLRDTDGDGVADEKHLFADQRNGVAIPFGMAFADGALFLGNTSAVLRFPYQTGQIELQGRGEKIANLPGFGYRQHWTRNVMASPDGTQLYVSIGSRSNVDEEPLPRAAVQVMDLDGSNPAIFAFGLRNPVGMDFHPLTEELYVTVNERDGLGDDLVPDYLTRIRQDEFYGWPYTYLKPDWLDPRRTRNGKSEEPDLAARTRTPDVLFQSHSAALGLQFYDGETFPPRYRNGAFVAFRGSWNRNAGTGYKVVFVPFDEAGRPEGHYEDFLTGFLIDPQGPTTWGRPVGLLVLPDGSLLITEEMNHRIYRVQYVGS